jgi:glycerophosphoryl diester phosphodiesterase
VKIVAHRGWSAGPEENTIAAFRRAARAADVVGVEFDVRRAADGRLIVSHDPPNGEAPHLAAVVNCLATSHLEALVELKEADLAGDVARSLVAGGLAGRALVFGPAEFLDGMDRSLPIALGVIVEYPWRIARIAGAVSPDVILTGWDDRNWARLAFRAWLSLFSLHRMAQRHSAGIVVGVASGKEDLRWLRKQQSDAAVVDMADPVQASTD